MSKRLVLKLGVMIAALGAMTLLQGCDDDVVVAGAWMPVGGGSLSVFVFGSAAGGGMAGGSSQGTTGAGGGGGQVSTGAAF